MDESEGFGRKRGRGPMGGPVEEGQLDQAAQSGGWSREEGGGQSEGSSRKDIRRATVEEEAGPAE